MASFIHSDVLPSVLRRLAVSRIITQCIVGAPEMNICFSEKPLISLCLNRKDSDIRMSGFGQCRTTLANCKGKLGKDQNRGYRRTEFVSKMNLIYQTMVAEKTTGL